MTMEWEKSYLIATLLSLKVANCFIVPLAVPSHIRATTNNEMILRPKLQEQQQHWRLGRSVLQPFGNGRSCSHPSFSLLPTILSYSASSLTTTKLSTKCLTHMPCQRREGTAMRSSSSSSRSSTNTHDFNNDKNKDSMKWMYRLLAMLHGSVVYMMSTMPNRILLHKNVTPFRYNASYVGGTFGHVIASVVSILLSSSTKSTISGNNYKIINEKLNKDVKNGSKSDAKSLLLLKIGLFLFSSIGIFAIPGEAAFHSNYNGALMLCTYMSFVKVMSVFIILRNITVQGSIHSLKTVFDEVIKTTKKQNKDGKIYQLLFQIIFYVALGNNLLCLLQPQGNYLHKDSAMIALDKSLHISAIARLSMISTIILTLRNTANESPSGSLVQNASISSIVLNTTLGIWAFSVGITEGLINDSFALRKSLNMIMLSWPFLYKAYGMITKKTTSTI